MGACCFSMTREQLNDNEREAGCSAYLFVFDYLSQLSDPTLNVNLGLFVILAIDLRSSFVCLFSLDQLGSDHSLDGLFLLHPLDRAESLSPTAAALLRLMNNRKCVI